MHDKKENQKKNCTDRSANSSKNVSSECMVSSESELFFDNSFHCLLAEMQEHHGLQDAFPTL